MSTFVVTNPADNGNNASPPANSLRQAIESSNANPGPNRITFSLGSQTTITVVSALPALTSPVVIDGTIDVDGQTQPGVSLVGGAAGSSTAGLVVMGGSSTIEGLSITGFGGDAIVLSGRGGDTVSTDDLGISLTGAVLGNADGVRIDGSSGNLLMTDVLSGNNGSGVLITDGASGNLVQGCFIGTDANGVLPRGNRSDGVAILGSSNNTIGGTADGELDVISANGGNGIGIEPGKQATPLVSSGNVVLGNFIGTDVNGGTSVQLGNMDDGVAVIDSPGNTIGAENEPLPGGSSQQFNANLISGNGGDGVQIVGHPIATAGAGTGNTASGNLVLGNFIGTDLDGNLVTLGNNLDGVFVDDASNTTIGGTSSGDRDIISGNHRFGVAIAGAAAVGNVVLGNFIGISATGIGSLGNAVDGVFIGGGGFDGLDPNELGAASGNTVGGTANGAENVISANGGDGVEIVGPGFTGNVVEGNLIGTDLTGTDVDPSTNATLSLGNARDGVEISGASGNIIGGTASGSTNLISGNSGSGIEIDGTAAVNSPGSTATNNLVQGDIIGLDLAGTKIVGNFLHGVSIVNASGNTVGGTTEEARDLISGNNLTGVNIQDSLSTGNLVEGDYIGTDISGADGTTATSGATLNLGNFAEGVFIINASGNTIGGTAAGAGDVISGNRTQGISIEGEPILDSNGYPVGNTSIGNVVLGDMIGTDPSGFDAIPNGSDGVFIDHASDNTVGGSTPSARNVISNDNGNGIQILGQPVFAPGSTTLVLGDSATGNLVEGNDVGSQANGAGAGADRGAGVLIYEANDNTIGGTAPGQGNVLSGNVGSGLEIGGGFFPDPTTGINTTATGNLVEGNLIGTTADGSLPLGNGLNGVTIDVGAVGNTIGGTAPGSANVISANFASGVAIIQADNPGVTGNLVEGNFIGTDSTGELTIVGDNRRMGNAAAGVFVSNSANNTVAFNTISGNNLAGIDIAGPGASGNLIFGNFIGTDSKGEEALGNLNNGLLISNAPGNIIGLPDSLNPDRSISGTLQGNLISGNSGVGVQILGVGSTGNLLQGNVIGLDASGLFPIGNLQGGVLINDASGNTVGGIAAGARNVISGNLVAGVQIQASNPPSATVTTAVGNVVVGNFIGTGEAGGRSPVGLGNAGDGVLIRNASSSSIEFNLISANVGSGVDIIHGIGNEVTANAIGTDVSGIEDVGNGGDGVLLSAASFNGIGGFLPLDRNIISGNGADGIAIVSGSTGNGVVGNDIGTNATGEAGTYDVGPDGVAGTADDSLVGNALDGVRLLDAGLFNAIVANLISANLGAGVEVAGTSPSQTIQGNVIGLDAGGLNALGNAYGVYLNGVSQTTVGGTTAGAGNVISGNSVGVVISYDVTGPGEDAIQGNVIGLNGIGLADPAGPSQQYGIFINAAPNVTIGGTTPGAGNVISGNAQNGVLIFDQIGSTSSTGVNNVNSNLDSQVEGNHIGSTAFGGVPLGPGKAFLQGVGVAINSSAGNSVGGDVAGAGNFIAGNVVGLEVAGLVNQLVKGRNYGNDVQDNVILSNSFGVFLNGGQYNAIEGDAISLNRSIGVSMVGPLTTGNAIESDTINGNGSPASGAAGSSIGVGVYVESAINNLIEHDIIDKNGEPGTNADGVGVYLFDGASGNTVALNPMIDDNTAYGILLFNSAGNIPFVARTGSRANSTQGNGIAQFREFTGPTTKTT